MRDSFPMIARCLVNQWNGLSHLERTSVATQWDLGRTPQLANPFDTAAIPIWMAAFGEGHAPLILMSIKRPA